MKKAKLLPFSSLQNISPGTFCPTPIPPTPGQPCSLPGALDCHYENYMDNNGLPGSCCCGQCDTERICAADSMTGAGLWQQSHPTLCPSLEDCGSEGRIIHWNCSFHNHHFLGIITSPNYPGNYPRFLEKTEKIHVKSGQIIRVQFTYFAVYKTGSVDDCRGDHVKVTDGDGTILMDKSCGYSTSSLTSSSYFLPPVILTNTNAVQVHSRNYGGYTNRGWRLGWGMVVPGL